MPATALALPLQDAQQTFTVQNKLASSTTAKPSPIISLLELGRRKTVDAAKICGGAENVAVETQQNIRKMDCSHFITLGIYTRWKRVYCSQ